MCAAEFGNARWIWSKKERKNQFVLFSRTIDLQARTPAQMSVRLCASCHYELFVNGVFIGRGPAHGDPQRCFYDDWTVALKPEDRRVDISILVHHSSRIHLHYLMPAPGGLIAVIRAGRQRIETDASWRYKELDMWAQRVPPRNWALDYCEDYNAAREPSGWAEKRFPPERTSTWPQARLVPGADRIWSGYAPRRLPVIQRRFREPIHFQAWSAAREGVRDVGDISLFSDQEPLRKKTDMKPFTVKALNLSLLNANAFTLDLGREYVGFYTVEIDAPRGTVIEVSGAELLRNGRPWIFRKGTSYTVRYRSRGGRQRFTSFAWNGFRYMHLVARGNTKDVRFHSVGCLERRAEFKLKKTFTTRDRRLGKIFDICRRTLEICSMEQIVDCPTREQTAAWADGLFTSYYIWRGFGDPAYMEWYLESFIQAPLSERSMIHSRYPGLLKHVWLDFALLPLIAQQLYRKHTRSWYKPAATLERGLVQKQWFDDQRNEQGLVDFDFKTAYKNGYRNFIDHPGLGMHNAPHPGLDREGTSCPLNIYYMNYVDVLSKLAVAVRHRQAKSLTEQAKQLRRAVKNAFYDGTVFHDTVKPDGSLSPSTSWHSNAFACYFGLIKGDVARTALRAMIRGYYQLCRGTPYLYSFLLPAMQKLGMEKEAVRLIKRDWGVMIDRDATTTWETFLGDERDSLCHPWATAPFLFLLEMNR